MEILKKSEIAKDNQVLSDFIQSANKNFVRKRKMMEILNNLSNRFKKENIILKNRNEEKLAGAKQEQVIEEKDELKLSLKKEDTDDGSDSINEMYNMDKNNNIEISMVQPEKLEEKQENIKQIHELINLCESDIKYLDNEIKNYENSSNDLLMKSQILDNISIIVINKNEEKKENEVCDNTEQKIQYYQDLKNKFISLKKKLEELLALYKTEKEFTEIKKNELEKLEKIKNEYKNLKYKKKM